MKWNLCFVELNVKLNRNYFNDTCYVMNLVSLMYIYLAFCVY